VDESRYQVPIGANPPTAYRDPARAQLRFMILVEFDEIAESDGEFHFVGNIERIESERLLQTHHNQSKAQRIEARIQQLELIGQSRELSLLLDGNLLKL
jgi:hypothetical protein